MTKKTSHNPQRERFIEAAREHGTDDNPEAFERVFGKIVPPKTGTVPAAKPAKTKRTNS